MRKITVKSHGRNTQYPRARWWKKTLAVDWFDTVAEEVSLPIGEIYNKATWADLTDFSNNGSTSVVSSGAIRFSGGAGTFTQSLDLLRYTGIEKWKITSLIKIIGVIDLTSYGFGFGIRSKNTFSVINAVARFVSTSGIANDRKALIHAGTANTLVATSAAMDAITQNDVIEIIVELGIGTISISARNVTAGSAAVTTSWTYVVNGTGDAMGNLGRFSIFSFGGTFDVQSLLIESADYQRPAYMFVGDSKTRAYRTSAIANRFGSLFTAAHTYSSVNAGGGDRITEALLKLPELILLNPRVVLLAIGSNDKRNAVAEATIKSDYDSLVSQLVAAGIRVIHLGPIRETSISVEFLYTHIAATYLSADIIDPGTPTLDADGVHPNDAGHTTIYNAIAASGKL